MVHPVRIRNHKAAMNIINVSASNESEIINIESRNTGVISLSVSFSPLFSDVRYARYMLPNGAGSRGRHYSRHVVLGTHVVLMTNQILHLTTCTPTDTSVRI